MIVYRASRPNIETGIEANLKSKTPQFEKQPQSHRGEYRRQMTAQNDPRAMQVFKMIERAANADEVCPTNRQIADQLGWKSISNPPVKISMLEGAGLIRVEHFNSGRIVTIVKTGKSTARPESSVAHWRTRPAKDFV